MGDPEVLGLDSHLIRLDCYHIFYCAMLTPRATSTKPKPNCKAIATRAIAKLRASVVPKMTEKNTDVTTKLSRLDAIWLSNTTLHNCSAATEAMTAIRHAIKDELLAPNKRDAIIIGTTVKNDINTIKIKKFKKRTPKIILLESNLTDTSTKLVTVRSSLS